MPPPPVNNSGSGSFAVTSDGIGGALIVSILPAPQPENTAILGVAPNAYITTQNTSLTNQFYSISIVASYTTAIDDPILTLAPSQTTSAQLIWGSTPSSTPITVAGTVVATINATTYSVNLAFVFSLNYGII